MTSRAVYEENARQFLQALKDAQVAEQREQSLLLRLNQSRESFSRARDTVARWDRMQQPNPKPKEVRELYDDLTSVYTLIYEEKE